MPKISISDVLTPRIQGFQDYWNERRGDAFAPSWRDIHLDELDPKTVPFIVVADVKREPVDFIFRFWGTEHVNRKGFDRTGKSIQEKPNFRGQAAWDEYVWVVENKQPLASKSTVNLSDFGKLVPFEQSLVRFPLSGDGVDVHHIISVAAWADSQ